ncbi:MAG: response regulator [bacterium]|nr:response regulator [bacterium]
MLILEDDERFAETLATEYRDRGYRVDCANGLASLRALPEFPYDYAIVDLRLRSDSGLNAIPIIKEFSPKARILILTGYGSIATAVRATKLGAFNYLTKPVDVDDIERAFSSDGHRPSDARDTEDETGLSLARHEREYIEYVLAECDGNISRAARRLGLHRQSLQRKLRKYTPR